ncbi:MAG: DUF6690 family protein, partial [Planctomycetota bacterium]
MRGLIIPVLLVTAVGLPIWLVYKSNPNPDASFQQAPDGAYNSSNPYALAGYQSAPGSAGPVTSTSPGSVYSPSAYSNPAPALGSSGSPVPGSNYATTNIVGLNQSALPAGNPVTMSNPMPGQPGAPPLVGGNVSGQPQTYLPQFPTTPVVQNNAFAGSPVIGSPAQMPTFSNLPGGPIVPGGPVGQTVVYRGNANGPDLGSVPMEFMPTSNLGEIFRFDISPAWIRQRWERISTSPGDSGLYGLRVPLVTGTNRGDLHGALTYYFDSNQKLQRISFRGWTGDSNPLLQLLVNFYGLKPQSTNKAGLYIADDGRTPVAGLLIEHPPVISSRNVSQQENLELE